jgi:hypothetical protein
MEPIQRNFTFHILKFRCNQFSPQEVHRCVSLLRKQLSLTWAWRARVTFFVCPSRKSTDGKHLSRSSSIDLIAKMVHFAELRR